MIPKNLDEICDIFDCRVQEDWDGSFWLGDEGDMSVGIFPYDLTPTFETREELKDFCESDFGVEYINEQAADIFCDWNEELQEWEDDLRED
jgi:hypothetical protein